MAAEVVKHGRAEERAKAKVSQQGGPSPRAWMVTWDGNAPLAPVGGEVAAGMPKEPEEDAPRRPYGHSPLANPGPVIVSFALWFVALALAALGQFQRAGFVVQLGTSAGRALPQGQKGGPKGQGFHLGPKGGCVRSGRKQQAFPPCRTHPRPSCQPVTTPATG